MTAKLVAYEYVPLGFEMIIGKREICPGSPGGVWNLWWNVKLTDDPEAWDDEVKRINKMQGRLEGLTEDQRLIRAQMAEFCRLHPSFPQSIDILCEEIGEGEFPNPIKMGCEGRNLLESLGYHDKESVNTQVIDFLTEYARSLGNWLTQKSPINPTGYKIFGFLGEWTEEKADLVKKLVQVINPEEKSITPLRRLSETLCKETQGDFEFKMRPFNCFNCLPGDGQVPQCKCSYAMLIDSTLLCIGIAGEERSMFDEFRRFTQEHILAYSFALNYWLKEEIPRDIIWLEEARYVTKDCALEIGERVRSSLGEKGDVKEWLAACLLKTIKDNQRWHKNTELIDGFPEAVSWFKDK